MPQAQKLFGKTLLYHTDMGECCHEGLIPTENSFYFAAVNKNHSSATGCWAPGHSSPGACSTVRMAWGMCGPVLGEQRLAVMGREASSLGWPWMGVPRVTGVPLHQAASAPTMAPKPLGAAAGVGFLVLYRR